MTRLLALAVLVLVACGGGVQHGSKQQVTTVVDGTRYNCTSTST